MADYAPNFTARYKLHYTAYGDQHDLGLRFPASMSQSQVILGAESFLNNVFTLLAAFMTNTWAAIDAEYSAANSDFFFPVGATNLTPAGTVNVGPSEVDEIVSSTWSGRTTGGHGTRFVMYGLFWAPITSAFFTDWTVTPSEAANLTAVRTQLQSAGMVGNDNVAASFWNPNVSAKVNDAWRKRRKL